MRRALSGPEQEAAAQAYTHLLPAAEAARPEGTPAPEEPGGR